jgi:hypothetical protein
MEKRENVLSPDTGATGKVGAGLPADKLPQERIRCITEILRDLVEDLKEKKLPRIRLNVTHWLDDYNGREVYEEYHGFKLDKEKFAELRNIVEELLKLAEIEYDGFKIIITCEEGILIAGYKDEYNEYGSFVGTDHFVYTLQELASLAKEKAENYNVRALKSALYKVIDTLPSF